jgi:hypothetical protein
VATLVGVAGGVGTFTLVSSRERAEAARADGAVEWRRHEERRFSLEAPAGWSVATDARGRVTVTGTRSERIVFWPFFVPRRLSEDQARSVARELAAKAVPEATWDEPAAGRPGVVRVGGRSDAGRITGALTYTGSRVGTAGQLFLATASEEAFEQESATFARILATFEPHGARVARHAARRFERWADPVEGAFSVEVPAGWSTSGGTERPSNLLAQATVNTTSPDSKITAVMTDALPVYVEPSQLLETAGIYEGGSYVDPSGYASPVRRYARGAAYVTDYVIPKYAHGARVVRVRNRRDLARQLATYGINTYDVGEVEYRIARAGQPYTGGALCITERISTGAYVAWHVWRLFIVEAPSDRYDEGVAAIGRLAASFRGYWARQDTYDALAERRSRATLEVEDLTDSDGNTYRVESGSSYYWIAPNGTIVGTDTDTRPDVDFDELVGVGG